MAKKLLVHYSEAGFEAKGIMVGQVPGVRLISDPYANPVDILVADYDGIRLVPMTDIEATQWIDEEDL